MEEREPEKPFWYHQHGEVIKTMNLIRSRTRKAELETVAEISSVLRSTWFLKLLNFTLL